MKRNLTYAATLAFLAWPLAAAAAVVVEMTIEDLSLSADAIARGEVVEVESSRDRETGRIYTNNVIDVSEWIKGGGGERITVRQLGGSHRGLAMYVPGTPRFKVGDSVLLFLKTGGIKGGENVHFLRGMGQGLFNILKENGVEMAVQQPGGVSVLKRSRKTGPGEIIRPEVLRVPLNDLLARIRRILAGW